MVGIGRVLSVPTRSTFRPPVVISLSTLAVATFAAACGAGVPPTKTPTLTLLTIEASDSCAIGAGGLPMKSYVVTMRDERLGDDWLFVENRELSGPREISLILRLQRSGADFSGTMFGPAIISTEIGQMTVYPNGTVTATATGTELTGTWSGRLIAGPPAGPSQTCEASDHRIRLRLPPSS